MSGIQKYYGTNKEEFLPREWTGSHPFLSSVILQPMCAQYCEYALQPCHEDWVYRAHSASYCTHAISA